MQYEVTVAERNESDVHGQRAVGEPSGNVIFRVNAEDRTEKTFDADQ